MFAVLLGAAGFLIALTLAAVYSACVLAHRTEELVARMQDDGIRTDRHAFHNA
ncbi:MAG: hypothetical protein HYX78_00995 [Armatimonadetes bacterium]|nr:hypothetical protein [Armatimonadota bacterium]